MVLAAITLYKHNNPFVARKCIPISYAEILTTVQELQAVKGKVEQLTAERDAARSDIVTVRQQRDCHADHAQLLVKENKRLSTQLQMLRLQQGQPDAVQLDAVSPLQPKKIGMQCKRRTVASCQTQSVSAEPPSVHNRKKHFDGSNVRNVLHNKPFDLSKGSMQQASNNLQAVLMQAQQLRAKLPAVA